jgi:serine/threonine protein kinase
MVTKQFYTKSIDLWALGIFLYELATSETPFKESQILMRNKFKDIVIEAQTNRDWKHFTLSQ